MTGTDSTSWTKNVLWTEYKKIDQKVQGLCKIIISPRSDGLCLPPRTFTTEPKKFIVLTTILQKFKILIFFNGNQKRKVSVLRPLYLITCRRIGGQSIEPFSKVCLEPNDTDKFLSKMVISWAFVSRDKILLSLSCLKQIFYSPTDAFWLVYRESLPSANGT